mgnify:CR=1 FL=1|jgi:hypothetical protein
MAEDYPSNWNSLRNEVLRRDEHTCQNCGQSTNVELEVHHIVPKSKGGTHKMSNLRTLCKDCHSSIHTSQEAPTSTAQSESHSRVRYKSKSHRKRPSDQCPNCDSSLSELPGSQGHCSECRITFRVVSGRWMQVRCANCIALNQIDWNEKGDKGTCRDCGAEIIVSDFGLEVL